MENRRAAEFWVRHECGSDRSDEETARQAPRLPVWLILDCLRSAHNVGSLFRTADGANAAALWLCGYTPIPPHRHLSKTALGAVDVVPWRHFDSVQNAIAAAREQGAQVLALEKTAHSTPLYESGLQFPLALVLGNEVDGLSEQTQQLCDATVHLPMSGLKNSLNVSVAGGIALYEIARRFVRLETP